MPSSRSSACAASSREHGGWKFERIHRSGRQRRPARSMGIGSSSRPPQAKWRTIDEYRDRAPGAGLRSSGKPGDQLRNRPPREAGGRRSRRPRRRHDGARHRPGAHGSARGRGLLPAHRRRRGADVRRREDPGRLLQAGGAPDRARHPHRADDRPADPAALAEGLPQRGAGDLHRLSARTWSRPTTSSASTAPRRR